MQLGEINTNTIEGRLLMGALAMLTTTAYRDKTPDEVLDMADVLQRDTMYKEAPPIPEPQPAPDFRESIRLAINRNNKEAGSDTPDIILTEYLMKCLEAFDEATRARDKYYLPS